MRSILRIVVLTLVSAVPSGAATNASRRNDFCGQVKALQNGTLELVNALRGMKLQAAVTLWDDGLLKKSESGEWSGFHFELMSALADRGGFEFEFTQHPFAEGMGWSDWLFETLDIYDLNVEYWTPTPQRANRGAQPMFGLFETSSQLAAHTVKQEKDVSYLSFLSPLSNSVWFGFIGLILATAFAFLIAEYGENEQDLMHGIAAGLANSLFLTCFTVTGAGTFAPKSWFGKLIAVSWAWCVLLFVATYTANLAAFLVVEPKSDLNFVNLDSALSSDTTICVWKGTPQEVFLDMYVKKNFPNYKKKVVTMKHPMKALLEGECKAAVGAAIELEGAQRGKEMNPCCSLKRVGEGLTFTEGAWMIKNDYLSKCTALVRDVLFTLSVMLKEEGFIDDLFAKYMDSKSDRHCLNEEAVAARCPDGKTLLNPEAFAAGGASRRLAPSGGKGAASGAGAASEDTSSSSDSEATGMELEAMAGMYLIHVVCLLIGMLPHGMSMAYTRYKAKKSTGSEENSVVVTEEEPPSDEKKDVAQVLADQQQLLLKISEQQAEIADMLSSQGLRQSKAEKI
eukprot:TRINITY_DN22477_c0_g1_i1.p1 TRINITY_DN22477_c0_g1~~TRINITY_DN22477_c0_g1_i1.p1  ORF type:complete len:567 (-),score=110.66 TRINITY_DN22477_c0_g1_i1:208-1908(-)